MNSRALLARIDHDDDLGADSQVVAYLVAHVGLPVIRREHFECDVGSSPVEAPRVRLGQAVGGDEGDVGGAHRVRVTRQAEAHLVPHLAESAFHHVGPQPRVQGGRDTSVGRRDRAHADKASAYELVAEVVFRHPLEFVGGNEPC
jgi:hypothetical protein